MKLIIYLLVGIIFIGVTSCNSEDTPENLDEKTIILIDKWWVHHSEDGGESYKQFESDGTYNTRVVKSGQEFYSTGNWHWENRMLKVENVEGTTFANTYYLKFSELTEKSMYVQQSTDRYNFSAIRRLFKVLED